MILLLGYLWYIGAVTWYYALGIWIFHMYFKFTSALYIEDKMHNMQVSIDKLEKK